MPVEPDNNGGLVFLAQQAAGQVAAQVTSGAIAYRGARSGNSAFDPASGRFTSKGKRKLRDSVLINENPVPVTRSGIPQGIDQAEWERRLDLVRLAAREFAQMDPNAAQGFLKDRVTDLSKVDVQQFLTDVRAHQIDDLLDVFDTQMRKTKSGVSLNGQATWVRKVFNALTDNELLSLTTRLQARGFSAKQVGKSVASRIKDAGVKQRIGSQLGVKLEDEDDLPPLDFEDWEPEPVGIDGTPDRPQIHVFTADSMSALADAVKELIKHPEPTP